MAMLIMQSSAELARQCEYKVGFFDEVIKGLAGFARRFDFVGNAPDGEFARATGEDDFGVIIHGSGDSRVIDGFEDFGAVLRVAIEDDDDEFFCH